jgi:iron complex outermembrane recepter protein
MRAAGTIFGALMALTAANALAQETQTPTSSGSVVVTATRTEKSAFDIPVAIDVVGGDDLREHRQNVDLSEGLGKIPGIVVQNRYNYAQDLQVSSRGFGARASFGVRGVRLIQDGIPLTMPDGQGQTALFDLSGAERVEVLRGPFAALYGNSSGGVIHLITADQPQESQVQARATGGDNDTWRGALNFSSQAGPVDFSGNVSRFETDGFRDHSAAQRDLANLWARYGAGEATTITLIGNYLDQPDTQDPLGLTQAQLDDDPSQAGIGADTFNTRKSIHHVQGGLVLDHEFSADSSIRALGYYGTRQITQYLANPSVAITGSGGVVDLDRDFGGGELRWHYSGQAAGSPLDVTIGVAYDRMDEARKGYVNVLGTRGDLRRDEDDLVHDFDQYLIATWYLNERWQLAGGFRHSEVKYESEDHFIVGANPDDSGSIDFNSTVPVLGLLFQAAPGVHVFASIGSGFETPTFSELAYRPDGAPGLNFDLQAAESTHGELGVKWRIGPNAQLNTTLFRSDTRHDIVTGPAPFPGRNTFVNADLTRREGAEVAASLSMLKAALTLDVAYTYTRARFEEFVNFAGIDLSGNQIPGVPENSAYADLSWSYAPAGLSTGLEARWADRVFADDLNSASADSYVVMNWHAGLRQHVGTWRLEEFVRVDNLFDESYVGSVIVNAANARYFEPAPERTWLIGFTASFSPR